MKREHLGVTLIGLMATATMLGSVSGLIHYAEKGAPGVLAWGDVIIPVGSIAFVAGLDGLAISLTVLAHRKGKTDWAAFTGLVLATVASTALQVAAVWGDAEAVIVHGTPAPCTAVAAFFLLRSLTPRGVTESPLPAPPMGAVNVDGPAPAPATEAEAPAPPVTGVSPAEEVERRPVATQATSSSRGKGQGGRRRPAGPPAVKGDELVRQAARWLMKHDRKLTAANVEVAVRAINGTCSKDTRTATYAALTLEEAMTSATGPERESD